MLEPDMQRWFSLYLSAASETNPKKVRVRVSVAREAMEKRLEEIGDTPERQQLEDFLYRLTTIELAAMDRLKAS